MLEMTSIEKRALKALDLNAFPLNLSEIRTNIESILSELQRYGFFNEYTTHSYDHVHSMLEMAEWIIPESSKELLTPADYLFLTLSFYFHDLGLLISQFEYNNRSKNQEFKNFLAGRKSDDIDNIEYMNKLDKLSPEEKDRILYQEFVRSTHGKRVKSWIEGTPLDDDDTSSQIRIALHNLIGKLDSSAREGLATLCESHTLDDISDTSKYSVSMPYGETENETVNLQYISIILRTVDLLQVTRKRAPSVLFNLINPKDPISQIEWQKQNAVRSIRPAPGRDREGKASLTEQSDTIQVFARFEKSDGFFGLTSYISYVRAQLNACQEALNKSEKELANPPKFPWKFIDDSKVEAVGFLTKSFGFELDQHKILDLLTGHTLYNDTDVVIRELTQNSLDAVRLQATLDQKSPELGRIDISWDEESKVLEIQDTGTGMSQEVIENHLLKVGSSRYQDPKFRENFPEFSSISRFGIGVLSAFMVADNVEITTCSIEDDKARQISLRSVHGKYLIKLLDKVSQKDEIAVYPHGSRIRLKLRSTANIGNILDVAKMWLLFPKCQVFVSINNNAPQRIGFKSPKEALQNYIDESSFTSTRMSREYEITEVSDGGVTMAFILERDELFNDWSFTQIDNTNHYREEKEDKPLVGICVEGVGVEFTTPGFKTNSIISIANIVGKNAPKTNVARSALEDTIEYRDNLEKIYKLYTKHIINETKRLSETLNFSLSRAIEQAPYLTRPLTINISSASKPSILKAELAKIPYLLIEEQNQRKNISFRELELKESFWTINSPLTNSVEQFIREAPKNLSALAIFENLKGSNFGLPTGAILCNFGRNEQIDSMVRDVFEPVFIEANQNARSIIVKWDKIKGNPNWINSEFIMNDIARSDRKLQSLFHQADVYSRRRHMNDSISILFHIGNDVEVKNLDDYSEFIADKQLYLNPEVPLSIYLKKIWLTQDKNKEIQIFSAITIYKIIRQFQIQSENISNETLNRILSSQGIESLLEHIDTTEYLDIINQTNTRQFNPFAWKRRGLDAQESGDI